jgi:hypothetical protein
VERAVRRFRAGVQGLDVLYTFGNGRVGGPAEWVPYIGAGPSLRLSHRGFETDDDDSNNVDVEPDDSAEPQSFRLQRYGLQRRQNFIAGARRQNGFFVELKATAWVASNIRSWRSTSEQLKGPPRLRRRGALLGPQKHRRVSSTRAPGGNPGRSGGCPQEQRGNRY